MSGDWGIPFVSGLNLFQEQPDRLKKIYINDARPTYVFIPHHWYIRMFRICFFPCFCVKIVFICFHVLPFGLLSQIGGWSEEEKDMWKVCMPSPFNWIKVLLSLSRQNKLFGRSKFKRGFQLSFCKKVTGNYFSTLT